jgi:capsular polysaccharide transport system permease protein
LLHANFTDQGEHGSKQRDLLPLPQRERSSSRWSIVSFIVCVVLPVSAAALYFGFFAANQYVSEFRFTVTDVSSASSSSTSGSGGPAALLSMVGGGGGGGSSSNFMVTQYLSSEQVITDLRKKFDLISLYTKSDLDWWSRFNPSLPIERFVRYWQSVVSAQNDTITGIATVTVRAFTPEDAHLVATSMVKLSEDLINGLQTRMLTEGLKAAEAEVSKAEDRLRAAHAKITAFRKEYGVIDPNASVGASNASLSQSLRATLAQLQATVDSLLAQNTSVNSPVVRNLNSQIKATKDQIAAIENSVTKSDASGTGGLRAAAGASLSSVIGQYEPLDVERQIAIASLTSAKQAYDAARVSAATQHLFLTPFVQPNLPQSSIYPKRIVSVALIALISFVVWVLLILVGRSIGEHYR